MTTLAKAKPLLCLLALLAAVTLAFGGWVPLTTGVSDAIYGCAVVNRRTAFAAGWNSTNAVVVFTTDGGQNWTSNRHSPTYLFGVDFLDTLNGWVAGYNGNLGCALLMHTTDGGNNWTWTNYTGSFGFYTVCFPSAETGYACGYQGTIVTTTDAGASWYSPGGTGTTNVFRPMTFVNESVGYAVAGTSFNNPNQVYRTGDAGVDWGLVHDFGSGKVVGGIAFVDEMTGYVAGGNGHEWIARTTDGGNNWTDVYTTSSSNTLQATALNGQNGLAVGGGGRIHRTTDAGATWALDTTLGYTGNLLAVGMAGNTAYCFADNGTGYGYGLPTAVGSGPGPALPVSFHVAPISPNPVLSSATLHYTSPRSGTVSLRVFDITGKEILNQTQDAVPNQSGAFRLNAREWRSGCYMYRIGLGGETVTGKIMHLD